MTRCPPGYRRSGRRIVATQAGEMVAAQAETILERVTREDDFEPEHFLPVGDAGDM